MSDFISRAELFNALSNAQDKAEIFAIIQRMPTIDGDYTPVDLRPEYWEQFEPEKTEYHAEDIAIAAVTAKKKFPGFDQHPFALCEYILYLTSIIEGMKVKINNQYVAITELGELLRNASEREDVLKRILESGNENR